MPEAFDPSPPGRGVFCNRTLNLRSIRAIGYDMDYTLVHYHVHEWERCAYESVREKLADLGWPVNDLEFDPEFVIRGLIIDRELGNIVKANRFGYVKRATHGLGFLEHSRQRELYGRAVVDLSEGRWRFLNTFFSLSEACIYAQLVEKLDAGEISGVLGYDDLHEQVRSCLDEAHLDGALKARIVSDPERFVLPDPEPPRALLDQREAGKKLLLITNSEWEYTRFMMSYCFDRFLPEGQTWRDLFDFVIVSARKPAFFDEGQPVFQVIDDSGVLRPHVGGLDPAGGIYLGGDASMVERCLQVDGSDILYVGDHIYSDVQVSKGIRRWRTAMVVREIEDELVALDGFAEKQRLLTELMAQKVDLEASYSQMRLEIQRRKHGHEAGVDLETSKIQARLLARREELVRLDERIAPLAAETGSLQNSKWGLLMRTGNDKSYLARQVERHSDSLTSRISNFLYATPFVYLRSPRGSLPHDPEVAPHGSIIPSDSASR